MCDGQKVGPVPWEIPAHEDLAKEKNLTKETEKDSQSMLGVWGLPALLTRGFLRASFPDLLTTPGLVLVPNKSLVFVLHRSYGTCKLIPDSVII